MQPNGHASFLFFSWWLQAAHVPSVRVGEEEQVFVIPAVQMRDSKAGLGKAGKRKSGSSCPVAVSL